jgi:mannose-6-phosphate isomerase-like protein (cupin superfamily)
MSKTTSVLYFGRERFAQGLNKGDVLVNAGSYQVHASRREKPGIVEVHTLDTDIFHILSGEATLVTGGTIVDPKTIEPNEIRGRDIKGGETRQLRPGDVIVIPHGVPHWFKTISGPVLYFAVKVRANGEAQGEDGGAGRGLAAPLRHGFLTQD